MTAGTTTEPIDTSDAASADGSAKLLSGRYKAAMVVGPFLVLWLLWRQLGSASVSVTGKYEGEVAGLEWLYRVPRSWTVDWFNFAGRDGGFKASGWVNTWFDHLRRNEFLDFTLSWHLSGTPWLIAFTVAVVVTARLAWRGRSGRWLAGSAALAWGAWSVDLLDFAHLTSTTPWVYVFTVLGLVAAATAWRNSDFAWACVATAVATIGWITLQTAEESFNVKVLIRLVARWLEFPLDVSQGLLISGYGPWHLPDMPWLFIFAAAVGGGVWMARRRDSVPWLVVTGLVAWAAVVSLYEPWHIPALPWIVIAGLFGVTGWKLGGWRLALLAVGFILYSAFIGEPAEKLGAETRWDKTMITLSAVLVAVPIAAFIGGALGLIAAKRRRVEQFLIPIMNLTQAFPHFTFLIPIAVFVGLSHKAGVIATIAYAIPPMARLTILGIQGISSEIIDAGVMGGCTPRQMLWKVELPAARQALLVGINQVVMECLAMVVIASFVGTAGLGQDLLFRLTGLHIGAGMEIGLAIVVMAITLDRLSQALGRLQPVHHAEGTPFWKRHPALIASGAVVVGGLVLARFWDAAQRVPNSWMWGHEKYWDGAVDWGKTNIRDATIGFRDQLEGWILLPMRDAFLAIPWVGLVLLFFVVGYLINGRRPATMAAGMISVIALTGFWWQAMWSLYQLTFAVFLAVVFGVPIGIWAAGTARRNTTVQVFLDFFQTFPSFVYLFPAIMFFGVSETAVIFAVVLSASVPAVRYTIFGIQNVPPALVEAATMSGCTRRQALWKVKLPMAVPEIMLGINQTIMFGLFMVMIAGLIKTTGLSRELIEAQPNIDSGRAIMAGVAVACIGMAVDLLISEWADKRKRQLGLIA